MPTLNEYLNEHPFHDYIFIHGRSVYQKPNAAIMQLYVDRIECDNYGSRYVIYVSDCDYYNHSEWITKIPFKPNKNIKMAKNDALDVILKLDGVECIDNIIYVHTRKKVYAYKLHCRKILKNLYGQSEWLPYLRCL